MKKFISLITILTLLSCSHYPPGVEETLSLAGSNRGELKKVLHHYQEHPEDSLKYKAACFLIDNMKWHVSTERASFKDSTIYQWHKRFDHLYTSMIAGVKDTALYNEYNNNKAWEYHQVTNRLLEITPLDTPTVTKGLFPDPRYMSSDFLISHIDNAFYTWHKSSFASYLSFEGFKEFILPYRAIAGYPFHENGKRLNDMFEKKLKMTTEKNAKGYITRYIHYTQKIRDMFGMNIHKQHVGLYDLFLGYKFDCISLANNACNTIRANGLPASVDYCISYLQKTGRHFHCVLFDSTGNTFRFNPTYGFSRFNPTLELSPSFFRNTFAAQTDSPFMLKSEEEKLPDYFDTPCLKEITSEIYRSTKLQLPITADIQNNLVYLYTYNNNPSGLVPSTWGTIDKKNRQVTFKNVVFNILYFPCYLRNDSIISFAAPFYLSQTDSLSGSFTINHLSSETENKTGTLLLHRKYPPKPYMLEKARQMVGSRIEGANREDFSDAVLLYTIRETPILNLQEYTLARTGKFEYYRHVPPKQYPHSNMAILEFLTDEYTDLDSLEMALPLPIYFPDEIQQHASAKKYARLHGDPQKKPNTQHNSTFDTDMKTSSYGTSDIMPLKRPMKVKKIRMAPLNAENHIVVGDTYQLMYWDGKWKNAGSQLARYNFLQFHNVPLDKIYWLRNISRGNEELPFIYRDGKQWFIYHDILTPGPERIHDPD